ncbi:hypothetical protein ACH5RR_019775 [Cinchona calisaya]|uniref:Wall-associated receptor kinase galacturonan-binding domain-containing protein n=1 Tax=Cinchona calisaya TaxID=153742 RepID=A0ABD2ZQC3_9GENT
MLTMRSFAEPTILLLLLFSLKSCHGQNTSPCVPSSCGNIHSITFPFRLKSDTRNCGDPRYELECQNNLTILILSSQKFLVQSIDYGSFTIRIVDLALANNNNSCSFPRNSILDIISRNNIYSDYLDLNIPLTFINCVAPVNSSRYVDIKLCTNTSSSSRTHSYIVSGNDLSLSDLEESCSVELVTWVARLPNTDDYASLSRIHEALTNGIELYWYYSLCSGCRGICSLEANSLRCHRDTICYEDVPYEEKSFLCKLEYWSRECQLFYLFPLLHICKV